MHLPSPLPHMQYRNALFGEGKPYADGIFPVLVEADAIQAEGFADATAAFEAFDK